MNTGLAQSIAALSSRWRNRFSRSTASSDPRHIRGAHGEKMAAKFLRRNGYKVLYRNFRPRRGGGQIDLVCRDGDTLVFVEVKTRGTDEYGRPVTAVHHDQQHRISKGALTWLRMLDNPEITYRFDVVEVMLTPDAKPRLELVQDAFRMSGGYR